MTNINVIFDDIFDDADIIAVPDEIVLRIKELCQNFLDWIPLVNDTEHWVEINNRRCLNKETNGFIEWLNSNYCQDFEKAYILARNTNYCPEFMIIEF